mmetsp:Transcript_3142/g.5809  ORF Transcript_3142/g.5809 Transcript_3142/m.5809 type:complete len:237 (+) Transcript_3142:282-992(+)
MNNKMIHTRTRTRITKKGKQMHSDKRTHTHTRHPRKTRKTNAHTRNAHSHSIPGSRHGCPIKRPLALHVPPGNSSANNDHSSSSSSLSAPSSPPSIAIGAEFENLTSRLADSNNPDFTTMRSPSTTVGCPIQNRKSNTSFSSSVAEIRVRVASRSSAKYLDFQKLLFLVLLLLLSLSLSLSLLNDESDSSTCTDGGSSCCSIRRRSIRSRRLLPPSSSSSPPPLRLLLLPPSKPSE